MVIVAAERNVAAMTKKLVKCIVCVCVCVCVCITGLFSLGALGFEGLGRRCVCACVEIGSK